MWFKSQANLVDTSYPAFDLLSASKLPCPGVVSREDESDVVGIGVEKRLKVAFSEAVRGTTEHGSHCPGIQCGEQAEHDGQHQYHDKRGQLTVVDGSHSVFQMN